ncbi:hypothetical protein A2V82_16580 [candidate division KSB1 bacterium RBG_16_48_16]|nr:MAG: hypothetical protein A2V82_16580 [candidate division KSB1 bacterium RBG_16_48_16]
MANVKKITIDWNMTGLTIYLIARREADNYRLNDANGDFAVNPADPYLSLTEDPVIKGRYELSESRAVWGNGRYTIAIYKQAGGSPAPVSDTIIGSGDIYIINDIEVVVDAAISSRAAEETVAKEATLATVVGYIDTEITAIINAISALQTDLGDPSADTTTLYSQLLLVKGYVDTLETAIASHEAARAAMQIALIAEHDATQAAVAATLVINVMSATKGAIQVSYAKTGGTVEVIKGDTISIPYGPLGKNITTRKLFFAAKQALGDTIYAIAVKEITAQVTDFTTFTGTIPLTSAETSLTPGAYYAAIESRDPDGVSQPVEEIRFILKIVEQIIL